MAIKIEVRFLDESGEVCAGELVNPFRVDQERGFQIEMREQHAEPTVTVMFRTASGEEEDGAALSFMDVALRNVSAMLPSMR